MGRAKGLGTTNHNDDESLLMAGDIRMDVHESIIAGRTTHGSRELSSKSQKFREIADKLSKADKPNVGNLYIPISTPSMYMYIENSVLHPTSMHDCFCVSSRIAAVPHPQHGKLVGTGSRPGTTSRYARTLLTYIGGTRLESSVTRKRKWNWSIINYRHKKLHSDLTLTSYQPQIIFSNLVL